MNIEPFEKSVKKDNLNQPSIKNHNSLSKTENSNTLDVIFNDACAYYDDVSNPENEKTAYLLFKKASIGGHAAAQNSLGVLYETGYGVEYHPQQALNWYKKSASNGDDQGMVNVARMLLDGDGIKPDHENAKFWLEKASRKGNIDARQMLDYMEENKPFNWKQNVLLFFMLLSIIPWTMFSISSILPIFSALGLESIKIGVLIVLVLAPPYLVFTVINVFLED